MATAPAAPRACRGVVASTGFGNGAATGDSRASCIADRFSRAASEMPMFPLLRPCGRVRSPSCAAQMVPAEILSKPTPIYTEEARSLRIEGEVLLEVVLEASGNLHVLRVVRGLGHGLDDDAVKAAEQIRFKPALKDGQPSDSTVVLHIIFQLA